MITAKFERNPSDGSLSMVLQGHAGAAPKGEDLICAGATMLAYTLAQTMGFLYEQGQLTEKPKIEIRDGSAEIIALPTEAAAAQAMHAFWVVQVGIHVLAHNYPQCVTLEPMRIV